jgi:hypothetical protein
VKGCSWVFLPCEEGFPKISLVYLVHGYLLVILDNCMIQFMVRVYLLTARLARRSTHSMKIINVEDSWVLLGVFKHQHLFSCKRDLHAPARVIM